MVDIPITQIRHRLVDPPFKSRHLDFHGAPAYAADDMMMVFAIRALTVERITIDMNDIHLPALGHQFQISVYGRGSNFKIAAFQHLDYLLRGDETPRIAQSLRNEQPRPSDTFLRDALSIHHKRHPFREAQLWHSVESTHSTCATRMPLSLLLTILICYDISRHGTFSANFPHSDHRRQVAEDMNSDWHINWVTYPQQQNKR